MKQQRLQQLRRRLLRLCAKSISNTIVHSSSCRNCYRDVVIPNELDAVAVVVVVVAVVVGPKQQP